MVWLDTQNRVVGFNEVAWQLLAPAGEQTLGVSRDRLIGIDLLTLHPVKSREKLALLLGGEEAPGIDQCPVRSPPAITMMINIPDRVLLLKVSKMFRHERYRRRVHGVLRSHRCDDFAARRNRPRRGGGIERPGFAAAIEQDPGLPRQQAGAHRSAGHAAPRIQRPLHVDRHGRPAATSATCR